MPISVLAKHDFTPRPFTEAAEAFGRKVALPSDVFEQLPAAARRRAFRIAGVNRAAVIQRARRIIERAIRNGTPYARVRRELQQLFAKESLPVPQLHRLQTLFRQNCLAAYSDQRRKVLDEPLIKSVFRFRQYLTVGNGRAGTNNVRDTHAALHGKVFAADDPFWDTFTPPWEWGCRCYFVALTAGQVKRMRVTVWTYKGGRVTPATGKGKGFGLQAHPDFARGEFEEPKINLKAFDAELRPALERLLEEISGE